MARYIEVESTYNWLKNLAETSLDCMIADGFKSAMEKAPTADVRENNPAEWIPIKGAGQWKCSNCGEYIGGYADCIPYINKFCWNCGSAMKGERT